jgi:RNA polymerase sigma-70 factor (ECF subfamily)
VEDRELVWLDGARAGDTAAFARLVEAYQRPVYNLAYRMLHNPGEAEDAVQETFVRVYTKLQSYRREYKLSSWILSIASHYCIDQLRRRRIAWLSLEDAPFASATASPEDGPERAYLRSEADREVQVMVDRLPPSYRLPLILRYWCDLSYAEIAEITGISPQAVKSRLHRARLHLADRSLTESPIIPMPSTSIR